MKKLKKRQREILAALIRLGGEATTQQVAEATNLHINGVAQTLGVLEGVEGIGGKGGKYRWRYRKQEADLGF